MRFFQVFLLLIATGCFTMSCSSDDNGDGGDQTNAELVGSWQLTEINVSEPIDTNNDGTTTTNLLTEVDCLEDTLTLNVSGTWSSTGVFPALISPITGNLYNVSCSPVINRSGEWGFSGTSLTLIGDLSVVYFYNGNNLTLVVGNDLPGIQSLVYVKQ